MTHLLLLACLLSVTGTFANFRKLPEISADNGATPYYLDLMSFNCQIFGKTKFSKPDVVEILLNIFDRNDVSMMMEIREKDQESFPAFVAMLNEFSEHTYNATMSDRKGRSQSQEQYGFIWRTDKVQLVELWENLEEDDEFEREPVVARFLDLTTNKIFSYLAIHISPRDAIPELNALVNVYDKFKKRYNTYELFMAGDYNADCNYVCKSCWNQVDLFTDQRFYWLVSTYANTTAAQSSCAYDRVVAAGELMSRIVRDAHVFRYDLAYGLNISLTKNVSDHYPMEFKLFLGEDTTKKLDFDRQHLNVILDDEVEPEPEENLRKSVFEWFWSIFG